MIKHTCILSIALSVSFPLFSSAQEAKWQMVWHDEFDIDGKPNDRIWSFEHGFVRNNEAQLFVSLRKT